MGCSAHLKVIKVLVVSEKQNPYPGFDERITRPARLVGDWVSRRISAESAFGSGDHPAVLVKRNPRLATDAGGAVRLLRFGSRPYVERKTEPASARPLTSGPRGPW
jgi:hypothetical protein